MEYAADLREQTLLNLEEYSSGSGDSSLCTVLPDYYQTYSKSPFTQSKYTITEGYYNHENPWNQSDQNVSIAWEARLSSPTNISYQFSPTTSARTDVSVEGANIVSLQHDELQSGEDRQKKQKRSRLTKKEYDSMTKEAKATRKRLLNKRCSQTYVKKLSSKAQQIQEQHTVEEQRNKQLREKEMLLLSQFQALSLTMGHIRDTIP